MHVLIAEDLYDRKFVESLHHGFRRAQGEGPHYPPERAAEICGISAEMIRDIARRLAAVKPVMLCYTLGITEHTCGKNNVQAVANLQMLLGNMGMECGGVNPLRGQNNVQGACDMGALPNVFPGYQKVTDADAGPKFEKAWGVDNLPGKAGPDDPADDGRPRRQARSGLLHLRREPGQHRAGHPQGGARAGLGGIPGVQDIFPNETTRFAHVVFPAAAWSENDGTFTNSERRVSRVRTASPPPGEAKPNWWIFKEMARRMGHDVASRQRREIWDNEISVLAPQLWPGSSITAWKATACSGPAPTRSIPGHCFLHKDGQFTCGLGIFTPWTGPRRPKCRTRNIPSCLAPAAGCSTTTPAPRPAGAGLNDLLGEETADISLEMHARWASARRDDPRQVTPRRSEGQGQGDRPGPPGHGLDGLSFPGHQRQLADQSRSSIRSP